MVYHAPKLYMTVYIYKEAHFPQDYHAYPFSKISTILEDNTPTTIEGKRFSVEMKCICCAVVELINFFHIDAVSFEFSEPHPTI